MTLRGTNFLKILPVLLLLAFLSFSGNASAQVRVNLADGFDFPVGKPDGAGYYKARGMRLGSPQHFGEDWNGRSGGDTDLGDPIYSMGDGIVTFAYDVASGWGNVVIVRYAYRDPSTGQVKYCDALYGHLQKIMTSVGKQVKRGEQIGTLGSNRGMYAAHLHFEIRHNINIGMQRNSVPSNLDNWADPTTFINKFRRLNREWRAVPVPTGTYEEYNGHKGL